MLNRALLLIGLVACGFPQPANVSGDADGSGGGDANGSDDAGPTDAATSVPFQSCMGLAPTCGPTANQDCCAQAMTVPGGMFYRSQDASAPNTNYPATLSSFRLDKYEVTVGRFRKFIEANGGTQVFPPIGGSGAHPHIANTGWDSAWNSELVIDKAALVAAVRCAPNHQTWTDTPGANENLPMNCLTWYEAFAFCIWDGGYLPTIAESDYASGGGIDGRAYPWSPSTNPVEQNIDCSYANHQVSPPNYCVNASVGGANRVGSESPKGDGKWGHADLAGNIEEWVLDYYVFPPPMPCNDCAYLTPTMYRHKNGGSFAVAAGNLLGGSSAGAAPTNRSFAFTGVRCARTP
jgi:formylglycine-generating enzyme required for sulfatase activity